MVVVSSDQKSSVALLLIVGTHSIVFHTMMKGVISCRSIFSLVYCVTVVVKLAGA